MSLSSLPPSWQADLAAARSGSMDALNRLFASVRPYLLKVAAGMLPDDLKARFDNEDLVQNTLLEAFVAFSSFRGSMSQEWLSWLLHILRHNAQDIDRRGHR